MKWEPLPGAPLLLLGTKWREDEWETELAFAAASAAVVSSLEPHDTPGPAYKHSHRLFDLNLISLYGFC